MLVTSFFYAVFKSFLLQVRLKIGLNGKGLSHFTQQQNLRLVYSESIHGTEKLKVVLERMENIVGKLENPGYQHFQLFYTVFTSFYSQYH